VPDLRYHRFAKARIDAALKDTPVVGVTGPRQSGKTTLVRQYEKSRPYITLDDATQRAAAESDPTAFVRGLDRAIIDEVQRVPALMLALKQSVDEDRRPGRFLVTGSADIQAIPKAEESLAGRIEIVPLLPLARGEIVASRPPRFIDASFAGIIRPRSISLTERHTPEIESIVLSGGYPAVLKRRSDERRRVWFQSYIGAIERHDITEIAALHKAHRVPRLIEVLARHAGRLVNLSEIGRETRLDSETVGRYIGLLENLYILRLVKPWSRNELSRLVSTPKLHFFDSGLLASLMRLTRKRILQDRTPLGPALESFVFAELTKSVAWSKQQPEIHHYRDKDQVEVDFVLENHERQIVGIEVKAGATVTANDFRGLKRLQEHTGDAFRLGIVLYNGKTSVPFGMKLEAMPYWALWM